MVARGLSEKTIKRRRGVATRFMIEVGGREQMLGASSADVEGWLNSLGVKPQSRAYYARDLNAFYRWAVRMELAQANPLEGREPERLPRYLPRPIATSDLSAALELADPRMRQMLVLAAFAGLRAHEIAGLDAADIDRERGVLIIRGKGNKDRVVPLHPLVAEALQGVRRGPAIGRLIAGRRGNLAPGTISKMVAAHLRAVGVDKTCHPLRHWFATESYRSTKDIRVVQELLGHASPTTTAVYTLVEDDAKVKAVTALSLAGA